MKKMLLVLSPLSLEVEGIKKGLSSLGWVGREERIGKLSSIWYDKEGVILAQGGHGKVQFALQSQYFVQSLESQVGALICAGCAGSLKTEVAPLDVVFATSTLEHDFRLKFVKRPLPQFKAADHGVDALKSFQTADFKLHFGAVASGDEDVIELERAREIHVQTGALAVAWEGAGGARAAKFNGLPFYEVRGITDSADSSAPVDFEKRLESVMKNVAHVLKALADLQQSMA